MVKTILEEAGFIEGKTYKETRFLTPPTSTYCIYLDSYNARGADNVNLLEEHDYTIEVYSSKPDKQAEINIENALDNNGIEYDKQPRYWIQTEQLYQVIYTFSYIEK